MKKAVGLILVLLLLATVVYSQTYNFRRYSVEEGLPRSGVYSIYQDTDGFLWIGTEGGGVTVFNGTDFNTYTTDNGLASNIIRTIFQDRNGNMWFGTQGKGATMFDGHDFSNINHINGLKSDVVRAITQDNDGNMWFGTFGEGIFVYDGTTNDSTAFKQYTTADGLGHNKVRSMLKDAKGDIWVGTDGGVSHFNGKTFTNYTTANGMPHNQVLTIFEDGNKNLWFGTKKGAVRYDRNKFKVYTEADGLIQNRVRAITEDPYGNMWFGTKKGVSEFDGENFYNYTEAEGLSNNRIRSAIVDSFGNLWLGTYFGGVNKYIGAHFVHYTQTDGLISNQVLSIYEDNKGHILLGTFDGVSKLKFEDGNLNEVVNITEKDGLLNSEVYYVYKDWNRNYWYGTPEGVSIFNQEKHYEITTTQGLVHNEVLFIYQADSSTFWVGTNEGVSRIAFEGFDLANYTIQNFTKADGLAGNVISTIHKDKLGNMWFGSRDEGLSIYDGKNFMKLELAEKYNNVISIIADNNQDVWLATEGNGLFKYEFGQNMYNVSSFRNFTYKEGLASNNAYLIIFDDNDNLWVGSDKGVDRINFDVSGNIYTIRHFDIDDGFTGLETNKNAVYKDKEGKLWFGTIKGVTCYNALGENTSNVESITHITNVSMSSEKTDWEEKKHAKYVNGMYGRFKLPKDLVLPYNKSNLTFDFVGISLKNPDRVMYQWKLEGFDEEWSKPSSKKHATYTNIPFGEYTFFVRSCNEDGLWNSVASSFSFTVTPPFWRTAWFYTLVVVVGLIFFYIFSQLRMRKLKAAKRRLEEEVNLRTQELRKEKELVESQNTEINAQKAEIETQRDKMEKTNLELEIKNKDITDSINYALRIQHAIMHPKSRDRKFLDNSFIMYRPKDIVSGDFYWYAEVDGKTLVSAADCTGHGVPGAFMSMIGITYLNQIVNKKGITEPAEILSDLRESVISALHRRGDEEKTKDGMDIALCCIDWENNTLEYAGAHNPLFLVRGEELIVLKADKMPIGIHDNQDQNFTNHSINIQKDDCIYMFSDGYVDQFGGPKGKKFLAKRLKNLLLSIQNLSIADQKTAVIDAFDEWIGDQEQIDDIVLVGLRI